MTSKHFLSHAEISRSRNNNIGNMKRSTVRFISTLMEAMGFPVVDTKKHKFLRQCLLTTIFLFTFWSSIQFLVISILQINNFYRFVLPLSYLGVMTLISAGLIANVRLLRKTKQLLKQFDENIYTYAGDLDIFSTEERLSYETHTSKIFLYIITPIFTSTAIDILSPIFQFLLMGQVTVIVYPGWIPWSTHGVIAFVCTYLLHIGVILSGTVQLCFLNCFPMFVVFEFRQQYRRLNAALRTIERRSRDRCLDRVRVNSFYGVAGEMQYRAEYTGNIVSCIRHYQMLMRVLDLFRPWWQIVFSVQLATSAPIFTLAMVCFLEANSIQEKLGLFTVICPACFGLLFYSYVGEEFLKLNKKIQNTIFYEIAWYQAPTEAKRLLMIFHLLVSSRPFTLNGLFIFQASYRVFSYICKSSYSYINVLRASFRK